MKKPFPAPVPAWSTPIRWMMPRVPGAAHLLVPEKAAEFEALIGGSLSLVLVEDDAFVCEIDLSSGSITLSSFVCELCWIAAYAYTCIYEELFLGRNVTEEVRVELLSDPRVEPAARLLRWGYEKWVYGASGPWPSDLPQPVEAPVRGTREYVATELAIAAVGVYLHHEAAHRYLMHDGAAGAEDSAVREKDADNHAVDTILVGLHPSDGQFHFRGLAIALAFSLLSNKGVHTKSAGLKTHPRRFDRLFSALSRHIDDPNHDLWGAVVVWMKLHLDNSEVRPPVPPHGGYRTFRECVSAYVDHLALHLTWEEP